METLIEGLQNFYTGFVNHPDFYKYLSIPVIASLLGWGTNWLAIKLSMWPLEFVGIKEPWLGWQGVVPRQIKKMAGIMTDQVISKLGTLSDFFKELEPEKIASHLAGTVSMRIEEYTDELMLEKNPVMWENTPLLVKNRVYRRAKRHIPEIVEEIMDSLSANIEAVVDLKHMIVTRMSEDKVLLVNILNDIGKPEFDFVIRSGLIFGLPLGIIQMLCWYLYPNPWLLPAFGIIVGGFTNFLALNLIFRPLNPVKVFGFTFQGRFLKRQDEVSEGFCRILTQEVLTVSTLMQALQNGPRSDRARMMIKQQLKPFLEGGVVKTIAQLTVGPSGYVDLKNSIEQRVFELSIQHTDDPILNRERGAVAELAFRKRMEEMSAEEFQELLRPAFQEDEWILIALGAALGFMAGLAQLFFVFGQSFV